MVHQSEGDKNESHKENTKETLIEEDVGSFNFSDFRMIKKPSPELIFGKKIFFGEIKTAEDAAIIAEKFLIDIYGEEQIIQQRPYSVKYDEANGIWWVSGNGDYLGDGVGGTANVFIKRDNGELITYWHGE